MHCYRKYVYNGEYACVTFRGQNICEEIQVNVGPGMMGQGQWL